MNYVFDIYKSNQPFFARNIKLIKLNLQFSRKNYLFAKIRLCLFLWLNLALDIKLC